MPGCEKMNSNYVESLRSVLLKCEHNVPWWLGMSPNVSNLLQQT